MPTVYATPRPAGLFSRIKTGVVVYKDGRGPRFMLMVTSNSYWDREAEAISTKALAQYVKSVWAVDGKFISQPLLFWHGDKPIGDIVWADTEGAFLLEVVKERPDDAMTITTKEHVWHTSIGAIWDAIEAGTYKWGASHGFQ